MEKIKMVSGVTYSPAGLCGTLQKKCPLESGNMSADLAYATPQWSPVKAWITELYSKQTEHLFSGKLAVIKMNAVSCKMTY